MIAFVLYHINHTTTDHYNKAKEKPNGGQRYKWYNNMKYMRINILSLKQGSKSYIFLYHLYSLQRIISHILVYLFINIEQHILCIGVAIVGCNMKRLSLVWLVYGVFWVVFFIANFSCSLPSLLFFAIILNSCTVN